MANKERGEVSFVAHGKTYTLAITVNAACALEEAAGRLVELVFAGALNRSLVDMRWIVWCALQEHHSDEIRTTKDAGTFIDDSGSLSELLTMLKALQKANADTSTDRPKAAAGAAGPRIAQGAASGKGSMSMPAASV